MGAIGIMGSMGARGVIGVESFCIVALSVVVKIMKIALINSAYPAELVSSSGQLYLFYENDVAMV